MGPFPSYLSRSVPVYVLGFNEMEKKGVGLDVITFDMNTIVQLTLDDVLDKNWGAASRNLRSTSDPLVGWCPNEEGDPYRMAGGAAEGSRSPAQGGGIGQEDRGDSSQCPSHGRSFPGSTEGYGSIYIYIYRHSLDLRQIGKIVTTN